MNKELKEHFENKKYYKRFLAEYSKLLDETFIIRIVKSHKEALKNKDK